MTYEEVEEVLAAVEERRRARLSRDVGDARQQAHPGSNVSLLAPTSPTAEASLGIAQATWGFTVDWSKQPVFNTRVESALGGAAMWAEAVETGRCVIPAAAFFEPHATETELSARTGRPVKRPYRFADPNGAPLLLAGVRADGHCSVVTCEPNRWVAPIHPRMPLALRFEEVRTWLSGDWTALADRAAFELAVQPEHPDSPAQLSLFQ